MMDHILTMTMAVPLAGAAILMLMPAANARLARVWTVAVMALDFVLTLVLWRGFDASTAEMQYVFRAPWIPAIGAEYHVGIDGVSLLLIMLAGLLGILAVTCSWTAVTERVKEFHIMLLLLQATMIGVFMSLDLFLFYIFWEVMLVPMYFLIGIWGSDNKLYSAIKFFLYTLFGSVFLLLGILALYFVNTTGIPFFGIEGLQNIPTLSILHFQNIAPQIPAMLQFWVMLGMILGFAIKVPMFPFHTWLPDAHTDAPTAGSVILAGVLLKMGTYGFFRIGMPVLPAGFDAWREPLIVLCLIGIIYGALVCLVQRDMKRLVAFSSVSHMGYVMLGLFAANTIGMQGGLLQMINHGISTGALFMLVGVIYERRHTRLIREYGGLSQVMPVYAAIFLVVALSSMGLPGLNGFIGEFMIILGAYQANFWWAFFAGLGVILAAAYLLWLYQRVFFGPLDNDANKNLKDVNVREGLQFAPLLILCVWMGLYPKPFLTYLEKPVEKLLMQLETAKRYESRREHLVMALPVRDDGAEEEEAR